jgi:hypothetical protein
VGDPSMWMQAVSTGAQFAGAGMAASTARSNSKAAQLAYETDAQIQRNNAQIAEWQAQDAMARGYQSASAVRMKADQTRGTQRATMAANGVGLGVGSALRILTDTDYFAQVDGNTVMDNAAKEAWALRHQATGFASQAMYASARAANENPNMAFTTSLLGSAGKVASRWYSDTSSPSTPSLSYASAGDGLSQGDRRKMGVY